MAASPATLAGVELFSTGRISYGRYGGALDGVRVLKPETVALMGQNHIGVIRRFRCTKTVGDAFRLRQALRRTANPSYSL
jgi:hypothetical protein